MLNIFLWEKTLVSEICRQIPSVFFGHNGPKNLHYIICRFQEYKEVPRPGFVKERLWISDIIICDILQNSRHKEKHKQWEQCFQMQCFSCWWHWRPKYMVHLLLYYFQYTFREQGLGLLSPMWPGFDSVPMSYMCVYVGEGGDGSRLPPSVFLVVLGFSFLHKNYHLKIQIRSG